MSDATPIARRGGWLGAAVRRHPLFAFFALAYALSWLGWLPLVAYAAGFLDARPSPYWHLLSGLGPLLAACVVSGAVAGGVGLRALLARATRWRVGLGWWVQSSAATIRCLTAINTIVLDFFDIYLKDEGSFIAAGTS